MADGGGGDGGRGGRWLRRGLVGGGRVAGPLAALGLAGGVLGDYENHVGARTIVEKSLDMPPLRQRAAGILEKNNYVEKLLRRVLIVLDELFIQSLG